ncbi:hypothetical protein C823_005999 [Eubacterium plexicaudatum ASF492]|uniref:Periplasmic binding protein domain-containing protein n=1 Tax=Eubacterium plexicaudatum ASF492 TaxID=1235802 RepID=N2ATH7_9FIRM|nr:hypothetical protein C823_005999 [Eubacterium plexicaudatum ASF492]
MKKKNSGKWFYIFEAVLAVMVVMLALMMRRKNGEELNRIAVVIQNSEDKQWAAFRYGLKMAAQDQGVELVIASTSQQLTQEEEIRTIYQEIAHGANAVIVQPVPGTTICKELNKIRKKVPVVLVATRMAGEQDDSAIPTVEPDHNALGRTLAEELLKDYSGNLKGKTIGMIMENDRTEAMIERKKGFVDTISHTGAKVSWTICGSFDEDGKNTLKDQPTVELAVALDDRSLTEAVECAEANNLHGALVYGIGNSMEAVYGLDTGAAECLIVPDMYHMGYQSLTMTAQSLKHYYYKMEHETVSFAIMHREDLFSEKNQEIIFTMSQ